MDIQAGGFIPKRSAAANFLGNKKTGPGRPGLARARRAFPIEKTGPGPARVYGPVEITGPGPARDYGPRF